MMAFMTCSTQMMVRPSSSRIRRISFIARSISEGLSPLIASSSSNSSGFIARARASSSMRFSCKVRPSTGRSFFSSSEARSRKYSIPSRSAEPRSRRSRPPKAEPIATFSRTLMLANERGVCSTLAIPRCAISWGINRTRSRPLNSTLPSLGPKMPLIRFNKVDFPAPFGPMSPSISPLSTLKLTSFSAGNPPKYFVSLSPSRIASVFRDIRFYGGGAEDHFRTPGCPGVGLPGVSLLVGVEDRLRPLHLAPLGVGKRPAVPGLIVASLADRFGDDLRVDGPGPLDRVRHHLDHHVSGECVVVKQAPVGGVVLFREYFVRRVLEVDTTVVHIPVEHHVADPLHHELRGVPGPDDLRLHSQFDRLPRDRGNSRRVAGGDDEFRVHPLELPEIRREILLGNRSHFDLERQARNGLDQGFDRLPERMPPGVVGHDHANPRDLLLLDHGSDGAHVFRSRRQAGADRKS